MASRSLSHSTIDGDTWARSDYESYPQYVHLSNDARTQLRNCTSRQLCVQLNLRSHSTVGMISGKCSLPRNIDIVRLLRCSKITDRVVAISIADVIVATTLLAEQMQ